VARCLSVRPSVCPCVRLSHADIRWKRLNISSNFFHRRVAPPFQFFCTKRDSNTPTPLLSLLTGASNAREYEKNTIFDLWNDARYSHSYYGRQIRNRAQTFEWYQFDDLEWPLTRISRSRYYSTSNNSKTVQYRANLQWRNNRKSYMIYRTAPFSMTLNDPYLRFQGHAVIWGWISKKRYRRSINGIVIGTYTRPTQQCHFAWHCWVGRVSKIFSDTKRRAVSATAELLV